MVRLRSFRRWGTSPAPAAPTDLVTIGLRQPELAARLTEEGYLHLPGFLDAASVARADDVFAEAAARLGRPLGDEWFPTILLEDDEVRAFITEQLGAVVTPRLDDVFEPGSFDVVRLDYSVKPASERSELGPHQDYTLVDEGLAQSLYLWIPLCDTDVANGALHVVPGSHRFANAIRSRHVPSYFDDVIDLVHESSVALTCAAGDLVVMVSGVVHHSPPNRSDRLRLAAHGIVKPAGVPLVFYFADDDTPPGMVECYELDIEAYVKAIHLGRPALPAQPDRFDARPEPLLGRDRFLAGMAAARGGT